MIHKTPIGPLRDHENSSLAEFWDLEILLVHSWTMKTGHWVKLIVGVKEVHMFGKVKKTFFRSVRTN